MKNFSVASTAILILTGSTACLAQVDTLQLYGQVGAGITNRSNQTGGVNTTTLTDNLLSASYFGFRGTEDLGGGLRAVFRLESGISPNSGNAGATVAGNAKFFNRQSYVGLDFGKAGILTLGRQFQASTDRVIQSLDVYNVAPSNLAAVPLGLFGVNRFVGNDNRSDGLVKYRVNGPAGLTFGASTSPKADTGGRTASLDLAQVTENYSVGAFAVQYDAPAPVAATGHVPRHELIGVGGNVRVGPTRLYLTYMDSSLEPTAADRGTQKNKITTLGVSWPAMPLTVVKLAYYHDSGTTLNGIAGRDGKKNTAVVSAEYLLSKRTFLYGAIASNSFSGGYKLEAVNIAALGRDPAASSTRTVSLGMKHAF